jgi:hypothetical protein
MFDIRIELAGFGFRIIYIIINFFFQTLNLIRLLYIASFIPGTFNKFLGDKSYKQNRRFNLGTFFGGEKGFSRLQTQEADLELEHLNSDSEVEEYSLSPEQKA